MKIYDKNKIKILSFIEQIDDTVNQNEHFNKNDQNEEEGSPTSYIYQDSNFKNLSATQQT